VPQLCPTELANLESLRIDVEFDVRLDAGAIEPFTQDPEVLIGVTLPNRFRFLAKTIRYQIALNILPLDIKLASNARSASVLIWREIPRLALW
jgi:hypothetical protein